jgi:hypothetical protein
MVNFPGNITTGVPASTDTQDVHPGAPPSYSSVSTGAISPHVSEADALLPSGFPGQGSNSALLLRPEIQTLLQKNRPVLKKLEPILANYDIPLSLVSQLTGEQLEELYDRLKPAPSAPVPINPEKSTAGNKLPTEILDYILGMTDPKTARAAKTTAPLFYKSANMAGLDASVGSSASLNQMITEYANQGTRLEHLTIGPLLPEDAVIPQRPLHSIKNQVILLAQYIPSKQAEPDSDVTLADIQRLAASPLKPKTLTLNRCVNLDDSVFEAIKEMGITELALKDMPKITSQKLLTSIDELGLKTVTIYEEDKQDQVAWMNRLDHP